MPTDSDSFFTDETWQNAFRWAYIPHPQREVAYSVTLDSIGTYELLVKGRSRNRNLPVQPFKNRLSPPALLQFAVYVASDDWETDQEKGLFKKTPHYRPNSNDLIVRYIKFLVRETMERRSSYAAVGIGEFLYTYKTAELIYLLDYLPQDNIGRVKSSLIEAIRKRFEQYDIVPETPPSLKSKVPTKAERELTNHSLTGLAPWVDNHIAPPTDGESILETYFGFDSQKSEMERTHALIDNMCAGFHCLVQEKQSGPRRVRMLDHPEDKLRVPNFQGGADSNDNNRFNPEILSETELIAIKRELKRRKDHREKFRPRQIRLSVDDQDYLLNLSDPIDHHKFQASQDAPFIKIYGVDDNEEILLEIIPLRQLNFDDFNEIDWPLDYGNQKESSLKIGLNNENDFLISLQVSKTVENEEILKKSRRSGFSELFSFAWSPKKFVWASLGALILLGTALIVFLVDLNGPNEKMVKTPDSANVTDPPINQIPSDRVNINVNVPPSPVTENKNRETNQNIKVNPPDTQPEESMPDLAFLSEDERDDVWQSFQAGRIKPTLDSELLRGKKIRDNDNSSIELQTPKKEATEEIYPLFRWQDSEGEGNEYQVEILSRELKPVPIKTNEFAKSGVLSQNSWRIPDRLPPGVYFWQVWVRKKGSDKFNLGGDARLFKIISETEKSQIAKAKQTAKSHLVMAILYARVGLFSQAEQELYAELRRNRDSVKAKRMLAQVQGWRRK